MLFQNCSRNRNVVCVISVIVIILNARLASSSAINYEKMMKGEPQNTGLYDANDKVISVNQASFKHLMIWKPYAVLMEFYNSFCGHCRRFAPVYKDLAELLHPWRHSLKVMAIDCSDDENNGLCREYEVMGYPTLRYFHLNFEGSESSMGSKVDSQEIDVIRATIAREIVKENSTDATWPNFAPLQSDRTPVNFFEGLSKDIDHGVVIFDGENDTLATEMILEFQLFPSVVVRKVSDAVTAAKFKLNANNKIAAVDLTGNIDLLKHESDSYKSYKEVISRYLSRQHLSPTEDSGESDSPTNETVETIHDQHVKEIVEEVSKQKHVVYQADLEEAIKYTIFHEIPKYNNISGETLMTLHRYINVLTKYNPLGNNGRMFLKKLNDYVKTHNHSLKGVDFENQAKTLASEYSPVFESKHYVGCVASKSGLRGFTCSLWKLFHFLTVQDAENDVSSDPLEILQAMHGYVKYFFGCTDCSNHFQVSFLDFFSLKGEILRNMLLYKVASGLLRSRHASLKQFTNRQVYTKDILNDNRSPQNYPYVLS